MHSRYPVGHGMFEEPGRARSAEIPRDPPKSLEAARREPAPLRLPLIGKDLNIAGFLKNFKIDWDAGDILLILIMLFLLLESDDEEILIMLALVVFMGF